MRRSVQQAQALLPVAAMQAVLRSTHGTRGQPGASAARRLFDDAEVPTETHLVSRAEGYYWLADEGGREVGPFASIEAAMADMGENIDDDGDDGLASGQALAEVEDELGMSSWIDPDTGALAEATWTRLEDH